MKKKLIALAALAVTGAHAQVTITGTVMMGYQDTSIVAPTTTAGNTIYAIAQGWGTSGAKRAAGQTSGLGVDTAMIDFGVKEDLGGGYVIEAHQGLDSMSRAGVVGGDASMTLLTPAGKMSLKSYKAIDYLSGGIGNVGAPGLDGMVFQQRAYYDQAGFDTKIGSFALGIAMAEAGGSNKSNPAYGLGAPTPDGLGLGVGGAGAGAASTVAGANGTQNQRMVSLSGTYLGGPLVVNLNYLSWDNQTPTVAGNGKDTLNKDTIRTSARYDFGSFKIGGAYMQMNMASGATLVQAFASAATSFGAMDLGAGYGAMTVDGTKGSVCGTANCADGRRTGYSLSATYNLSKSTKMSLQYWNWLGAFGNTANNTQTELALTKNF